MLGLVLLASLILGTSSLTAEELALFKPRIEDYTDPNTGIKPTVSARDNGDGSQTISTNGIPSHETWTFPNPASRNPNEIKQFDVQLNIYAEPIMRTKPLNCTPSGYVGIATSGTAIFDWFPAEEGCTDVKEFEQLDMCEGHPSPFDQYHYHYYSPCVQMPVCGTPSPIYGVALDGIPIYGPINEDGVQLTSQDLDECGGRTDKDGRYKYHVVADPAYFMTCFKGEIRSDSGKREGDFVCACPHDDSMFKGKRESRVRLEPVCSFHESDQTQPITCWDEQYLSDLAYQIPFRWDYEEKEIDLIPCCPKGQDCGTSCTTGDGIKDICEVGKKTVKYLTRYARDVSHSVPVVLAWATLLANLLCSLMS